MIRLTRRRRAAFAAFSVALFAGGVCVVRSDAPATQPAAAATRSAFQGKAVLLFMKGDMKADGMLADANFEVAGGKTFLVGRQLAPGPLQGLRVWVAADEILTLAEFKDFEEFKRREKAGAAAKPPAQPETPDGKL